jgi:transposase
MTTTVRCSYSAEFKEQAVKYAKEVGVCPAAVELGLVEQTLRYWVKRALVGTLHGTAHRTMTREQLEIAQLRSENVRLKTQVHILEKATAYFAQNSL